jgi:hypothetical protein
MAYVIPNFNLLCNIQSYALFPIGWRIINQPCALVFGRRTNTGAGWGDDTTYPGEYIMSLLLPALTDIRGPQDTISLDVVECPAGSGRLYQVCGVDDIGKGYPNEHRSAAMFAAAGTWVAPYP